MSKSIQLGFEVGSGAAVRIPLGHTIVLGQTQLSGKTTTLQAMTERSGVCAIAFITKRGEKSFRGAREIPPYFTETSVLQPYWKFVISMIEGVQDTKLGFRERGWVMQLCREHELTKTVTDTKGKKKPAKTEWKEPKTLSQVLDNADKALEFSKGVNQLICMQLVEYLKMAVPEIEAAKLSSSIRLQPGINVMDISKLSINVQSLVLRSVVEWVYTTRKNTVVIIPEAWKFLPEGRGTPVTFPVEELIRQGAALGNYVWIDLQDLRGIKKQLLRSIQVWLFGVQREKNEVSNTLKSMPTPEQKPTATELMRLSIGQFIAAYGNELRTVYVWPAGMEETHAQAIAMGQEDASSWKQIARALDEQKTLSDPGDDATDPELLRMADDRGDRPGAGESSDTEEERRLGGALREESKEAGEEMWKEKYDELKAEFDQLREAHDALAERIRASEVAGETVLYGKNSQVRGAMTVASSNGHQDLDATYRYIIDRASKEKPPALLNVLVTLPELKVIVQRRIIEADGSTLKGALARLVSEKFFDTEREFNEVRKDLIRRGFLGSKAPNLQISNALQGLVSDGFLTKEDAGYQAVAGMKVNIVEVK